MILYLFHNEFWTTRDYVGAMLGDGLLLVLAWIVFEGILSALGAWETP